MSVAHVRLRHALAVLPSTASSSKPPKQLSKHHSHHAAWAVARFMQHVFIEAECAKCAAFGLDSYRKDLDDRGLAIAAAQEASLKGRRQLADLTKGERCSQRSVFLRMISSLNSATAGPDCQRQCRSGRVCPWADLAIRVCHSNGGW